VFEHPGNISPFGCLDMVGNLAEWCRDNARPNYSNQPAGLDPVYLTSDSAARIVRGGSGLHDASYLRCTSRDYYVPELRDNMVGFRVVQPGGF
jgi:formylglycine-generating enzyme required for sulfatase activity